jgi:hypothetical protein
MLLLIVHGNEKKNKEITKKRIEKKGKSVRRKERLKMISTVLFKTINVHHSLLAASIMIGR